MDLTVGNVTFLHQRRSVGWLRIPQNCILVWFGLDYCQCYCIAIELEFQFYEVTNGAEMSEKVGQGRRKGIERQRGKGTNCRAYVDKLQI